MDGASWPAPMVATAAEAARVVAETRLTMARRTRAEDVAEGAAAAVVGSEEPLARPDGRRGRALLGAYVWLSLPRGGAMERGRAREVAYVARPCLHPGSVHTVTRLLLEF